MPVAPLEDSLIPLSQFRNSIKAQLLSIFESIVGPQGALLILDPSLSGPLGLILEVSVLKEKKVWPIAHLTFGFPKSNASTVIFLIRPTTQNLNILIHQVGSYFAQRKADPTKAVGTLEIHLVFVPRTTLHVANLFAEHGYFGENKANIVLKIHEFNFDVIPFDTDLLSMEMPQLYREFFLDKMHSSLFYTARALLKMESTFGLIPQWTAMGPAAYRVYEIIKQMKREPMRKNNFDQLKKVPRHFDEIILVDRSLDLIAPLLTQVTYEGLIDEIFGINNGVLKVDPDLLDTQKMGQSQQTTQKKKKQVPHLLNSSDPLFKEIRDFNMGLVGSWLHERGKHLGSAYKRGKGVQSMQIQEIVQVVSDLKSVDNEVKVYPLHVQLCGSVNNSAQKRISYRKLVYEHLLLEDPKNADEKFLLETLQRPIPYSLPLFFPLRLLCLKSLLTNGLAAKPFEQYAREFCHSYGYQHILTFKRLEQLGLLSRNHQTSTPKFKVLKNMLKLTLDPFNPKKHRGSHSVYSGYSPMLAELAHRTVKSGFSSLKEVFRVYQCKNISEKLPDIPDSPIDADSKRILVVFVGGVTFAELSALRILSSQSNVNYIFLTTCLLNGNTFLENIIELNPSGTFL